MSTITSTETTVNRSTKIASVVALSAVTVALSAALALVLAPSSAPIHAARVAPHPITKVVPPTVTPAPSPRQITIAAVGDSITAENGDTPVGRTWPLDLESGPVVVDRTQGWAVSGKILADMDAGMKPTTTDYLVVMGGVNDRAWHTPVWKMSKQLEEIVSKSGEPADRVIISAIAPARGYLSFVAAWNAQEQALAAQHGWHYINPWLPLTGPDGNYIPTDTIDGTHPTDAGEAIIANEISTFVQGLPAGR